SPAVAGRAFGKDAMRGRVGCVRRAAMRASLHLLLALMVVWCGLHLAGPVEASAGMSHADRSIGAASPGHDHHDGAAKVRAPRPHPCPAAPAVWAAAPAEPVELPAAILFAASATTLASLSPAPPLQPPSA